MTGQSEPLEGALGYRFARPQLLTLALTHASAGSRGARRPASNERLEFLGDRVLGLAVAEILYRRFPKEDEGALAKRFAALVRREALARIAAELDLARHLTLSPSEESSGGRDNPALLANAFEAVIAAVFLDGGWDAAHRLVAARFEALIAEDVRPPTDAKTALQEWAQGRGLERPGYRIVRREGPSHAPHFTVAVRLSGWPDVEATGPSKRAAEQAAAEAMLGAIGEVGSDG